MGDSYTIGEGVPEADRWSVQLARTAGLAAPDIIARTGWTTGELQQAIRASNNSKTYDLVSLLIGVNNQYQGRSLSEYRAQFTNLLNTAINYAGKRPARVAILSIPDWSVTPFAAGSDTTLIRMQIDEFNKINKEITLAHQVLYIDITHSTRMARTDRSLLAADSLHPSAKEYAKWATQLAAYMKTVL